VELNHQRADEERRGIIRWLRPEFQNPSGRTAEHQQELALPKPTKAAKPAKKMAWPKTLTEQIQVLRATMAALGRPATAGDLAQNFKGNKSERIAELLAAMEQLGQARTLADGRYAA
jgi:hypothetical protein